jgi:hypothetical protein
MQLAFITAFTVSNESGETIEVTPIGTYGKEGKRLLLPVYGSEFPAFRTLKRRHFRIEDGQSVRILYDWDDINLSEIAVRAAEGKYYQLAVDESPTENQYHAPVTDRFIIPPVRELEPIAPDVLRATGGSLRVDRLYSLPAVGLALPFVLWWLVHLYRREKRVAAPSCLMDAASGAGGCETPRGNQYRD